jgi:hypothetical protein
MNSIKLNECGGDHTPVSAGNPAGRPRRPWSSPAVITSELSKTKAFHTSSTDATDHGVSYGS